MIEEVDDEVAAEGRTEAEDTEETEEEASLLPLGAPPFSCFRPTMAMQCGPGPLGRGTHADRAGACIFVCFVEGNVSVWRVRAGWEKE